MVALHMANDLFLKTGNFVHQTLLKLTGGRIGWDVAKMPAVQLTTIGRKSGQPRTVMLTCRIKKTTAW
jgi:hypothetical protein